MVPRKPGKKRNGMVHGGSWGMLMVARRTARFLWFDDPQELLGAVLDCVAPAGRSKAPNWHRRVGTGDAADEEERLNSFLLLEGLIKDINRREREHDFRVSWWGPLTDLQESRAPVPAAIRAWFRRYQDQDGDPTVEGDGAIPRDHLPVFAEFLDRVTFGADELDDV